MHEQIPSKKGGETVSLRMVDMNDSVVKQKLSGNDVEQAATFETLRQLGNMHMVKGDFARATSFLLEATSIHAESGESLNIGDIKILQIWAQLGKCQLSAGQTVEAMHCFQRALCLFKKDTLYDKTVSPEASKAQAIMGSVLYNIGIIHASSEWNTHRQRAKALRSFTVCLDMRRISLGDDHPAVAHVHYNIALLLKDEEKLDQAMNHLKSSVSILRQAHGPHSAKLVPSLLLLATIHEQCSHYIRAVHLYQEVLWCLQSHMSPTDVESSLAESLISVEDVWIRLGRAQQTLGQLDSAMASYDRAVTLLQRHHGAACGIGQRWPKSRS